MQRNDIMCQELGGDESSLKDKNKESDLQSFRFLMTDHFALLTYKLIAVIVLRMMTACIPIFFRKSNSGSEVQDKKVVTSFAICEVVEGVPVSV